MKKKVPLIICFIGGILMIFQYYFQHPVSQLIYNQVLNWTIIIKSFALILGIASLAKVHLNKIKNKKEHYFLSYVTLTGLAFMALSGIIFGKDNSVFKFVYNNMQIPMQATMFSLLAFFIASASYRAFRARTFEATLLLISAGIVILGQTQVGVYLADLTRVGNLSIIDFAAFKEWILNYPNVAIKRALIFGITIGIISTSIKVIFGIERSWLG